MCIALKHEYLCVCLCVFVSVCESIRAHIRLCDFCIFECVALGFVYYFVASTDHLSDPATTLTPNSQLAVSIKHKTRVVLPFSIYVLHRIYLLFSLSLYVSVCVSVCVFVHSSFQPRLCH